MSDSIGGMPPVPVKYLEAVADQKAGVVNHGPLRRFRFMARRPDGMSIIFPVMASSSQDAAERAHACCDRNGFRDPGRVVGNRSAYDRASAMVSVP
ncbi:hypothetical protein CFR73_12790 [Novacetimonas maltaceti]|uniref:Uncharacterized protein n=2 Tax=Novacetimonas maltaceti TaxID=1203393 RepID=A0A2S3W017_9PROT|nr:hypothetical protein KMAL_21820 [Novacetimonas maltaceti]PYD59202.1 hypothetical protein CFR73_12790 [Novacetimonas maltaceti]BCZ75960.1 hypothetical protein [Komagataeibacter phage phiKM1]